MIKCGMTVCAEEATDATYGIDVCAEHKVFLYNDLKVKFFSSRISRFYTENQLTIHSPGVTYIVTLGNGNIKIGYSRDYSTLSKRMRVLHKQFSGEVHLLGAMAGGETLEAELHWKFNKHRILNLPLEQFKPASEILEFADKLPMEANGILADYEYGNWVGRPGLDVP